ncbi:hypothetical protein BDV12DRAFT_202384 [Aspergillus spectabilis]
MCFGSRSTSKQKRKTSNSSAPQIQFVVDHEGKIHDTNPGATYDRNYNHNGGGNYKRNHNHAYNSHEAEYSFVGSGGGHGAYGGYADIVVVIVDGGGGGDGGGGCISECLGILDGVYGVDMTLFAGLVGDA